MLPKHGIGSLFYNLTVLFIQKKKKKKKQMKVKLKCFCSPLIYTHGNKLGNMCNNVTTKFELYESFFVKNMKNVLTNCQN